MVSLLELPPTSSSLHTSPQYYSAAEIYRGEDNVGTSYGRLTSLPRSSADKPAPLLRNFLPFTNRRSRGCRRGQPAVGILFTEGRQRGHQLAG